MKIIELENFKDVIEFSKDTKWFIDSKMFELYKSNDWKILTLIFENKKYAILLDEQNRVQEIVDEEDFSVCNQLTEDIINRSIIEWLKKQKKL
jgi:hypothetical protein